MATKNTAKILLSCLLISSLNTLVFAQKLPNVQEKSIWASSPVKIDGKTSDVTFEAANKSTMLSYTISNDEKNLYLVIKSTDNMNNSKIMMGGITLSINTEGKKKENEGFSITYPVIVRQARGQATRSQGGTGGPGQRTLGNTDSAMLARRKQQLSASKEIKVLGFKDIRDTLISIYNEHEISAMANFDEKGTFIYELALPLKALGLSPGSKEFAYNIKINGRQFGGGFGGVGVVRSEGNAPGSGQGTGGGFGGGQGGGGRGGFDPSIFLPTDFWGKYTLARK